MSLTLLVTTAFLSITLDFSRLAFTLTHGRIVVTTRESTDPGISSKYPLSLSIAPIKTDRSWWNRFGLGTWPLDSITIRELDDTVVHIRSDSFLSLWSACFLGIALMCFSVMRIRIGPIRRYPFGHCQSCGYDLTSNVSGKCPECGTKTKSAGLST